MPDEHRTKGRHIQNRAAQIMRYRWDSRGGLQDALDRVVDVRSFIDFLHALAGDWTAALGSDAANPTLPHSSPASEWQNGSIGSFFDAAATWADASKNGLGFYNVPTNPWRRVADILRTGRAYE
jgi:hypothetical protein